MIGISVRCAAPSVEESLRGASVARVLDNGRCDCASSTYEVLLPNKAALAAALEAALWSL